MSFFAELKRRNVFKVGVAYAIVAWLIVQVISAIHNPLHLPDWFDTVVIVLLIIGFILAIILAWAYELTPEGIKSTSSEGPAQYHTRTTGQQLNYFIMGVLVLAVAFILVDRFVLVGESVKTGVASFAGSTKPASTSEPDTTHSETTPVSPIPAPARKVRRAYLSLGQTLGIPPANIKAFVALSRDGEHLVYVVNKGTNQLYHRQLNKLMEQEISNVSDPRNLCFSPNGEWVGFTNPDGSLNKVSLLGGAPQKLVESVDYAIGCFWSVDNVIYFSMANKLNRVPAVGGKSEAVNISSELSGWDQGWPYGLPDGKHLLLTVTQGNANEGHTALLSLETGETRILIQNAYNARYVPTGHIVFMRSGSLWAVPFDVKQLKNTGPEVPVIDGVETHSNTGIAGYTFSDDGLLVYLPGEVISGFFGASQQLGLVWVDRNGKETSFDKIQTTRQMGAPIISPDGKHLAVGVPGQSGPDIWTYDLARETFSRRTFTNNAAWPIWTPDGKHLVFTDTTGGIDWTKADGTGQPESLVETATTFIPTSFTPDGSQLVFTNLMNLSTFDIHVLSMTGERTQQPLIATEFIESQAVISPDGRWIAYSSTETGKDEVYVRPYPDVDNGKWQISTGGGMQPCWRRDGKELFYALGQYAKGKVKGMVAVAIDTESGFQAGNPEVLFTGDYVVGNGRNYDVIADGQRFLMLKDIKEPGGDIESQLTNLVTVENWFEELKQLAPPGK